MTIAQRIVALIDLGDETPAGAAAALQTLTRWDVLGGCVTRALVRVDGPLADPSALPGEWTVAVVAATQAAEWAFDMAEETDAALLILSGGIRPTAEAVGALQEGLLLDPLFGIAVPRVSVHGSGRVMSPKGWHGGGSLVPMSVLEEQAEFRVLPELLAPCLLIRRELTGNLAVARSGWRTLGGLLADYAVRARRAGFRTVLCNRAIVEGTHVPSDWLPIGPPDLAAMQATHKDLGGTRAVLGSAAPWQAEHMLAAVADVPNSLLLDARNLTPVYNGTAAAILQLADAIYRIPLRRGGHPMGAPGCRRVVRTSRALPGVEIARGPLAARAVGGGHPTVAAVARLGTRLAEPGGRRHRLLDARQHRLGRGVHGARGARRRVGAARGGSRRDSVHLGVQPAPLRQPLLATAGRAHWRVSPLAGTWRLSGPGLGRQTSRIGTG